MPRRCKAVIRLFPWELESIPDYSRSLPTGQTFFKTWKRKVTQPPAADEWVIGRYVPDRREGYVGIRWHDVELRHGPKPQRYSPPDWVNRKRWRSDHAT